MKKVRLFPGFAIIMHSVPMVLISGVLAAIKFAQGDYLTAGLGTAFGLFWIHGLGTVVVKPGFVSSLRITGRKTAATPAVIAVDIDMVRRRVYAWFYANYFYPVLTLDTGKVIRLPIATSSRATATKRATLLCAALAVPAPGAVPIPEGRLARALSGSSRQKPAPEVVSFNPAYDIEGFSGE